LGVEQYLTVKRKLALLIESACTAKLWLVQEKGIGEDMPSTLVGWKSHKVNVLVQADERLRSKPLEDRHRRLEGVALNLMRGWCPDEMTLISEGYCNVGSEDDDRPLAEAFVDNPSIKECLTFVHVAPRLKPFVVAVPYSCGLGRVTTFDAPSRAYAADFEEQWGPIAAALGRRSPSKPDPSNAEREIGALGWSLGEDVWGS
jgi:hypothetical protein